MGTKLWVALLFVVLALLIFIGISRIVAEAGLAAVRAPMIAPDLVMQGLGSTLVGSGSVFNMSLAYIWPSDIRIFILALLPELLCNSCSPWHHLCAAVGRSLCNC